MRAPSRTIPELCEKRPGRPGFSKREKNLNWENSLRTPRPAAQFRNCAATGVRPRGCGHGSWGCGHGFPRVAPAPSRTRPVALLATKSPRARNAVFP